MKPRKIAFYGLFGQQNWGNECTLQAIIYNARRYLPDAELRCFCTGPHETLLRHNIRDAGEAKASAGQVPPGALHSDTNGATRLDESVQVLEGLRHARRTRHRVANRFCLKPFGWTILPLEMVIDRQIVSMQTPLCERRCGTYVPSSNQAVHQVGAFTCTLPVLSRYLL